ncbi:hypothetical protein Tco_1470884, partial [Tanacetum coccineum]
AAVSRWPCYQDLVPGSSFRLMLQVLVDQMSVPFVHRTSVVSVLTPMETTLYLLCRHCSLPPERIDGPYLLRRLLALTLPLEETTGPYLIS